MSSTRQPPQNNMTMMMFSVLRRRRRFLLCFFFAFFFLLFSSIHFVSSKRKLTPQWILVMNGLMRHNNLLPTNNLCSTAIYKKIDFWSKIPNFLFSQFSMCDVWALKRIFNLCVCNISVLFYRMFALQIEENVWRPRALFLFYVIAASNACTEVSYSLTVRAHTQSRSMVQCMYAAMYKYTSAKHSHSLIQDKNRIGIGINRARNKKRTMKKHGHYFSDDIVCVHAMR